MPLLTISSSINESLKKNEIFPDVLDEFDPKGLLVISYGNNNEVALGNTLKVSDTQTEPIVQFTLNNSSGADSIEIKDSDLFTLVLTDPDAPSRTDKKWSEYAHFIKTNISLNSVGLKKDSEFNSSELENGDVILPYQGPAPPKGTGKHRYVFVLYRQQPSNNKNFEPPKSRPNWNYNEPGVGVKKWANSYNLEPFALNFFNAENK
ncbi:hypothetical protein WICMUC_004550 [Wickerhamomyces mucosus]|uniref:Carboxypeptidase Y inhibitor n=1 Tax=Wickerhamomyces mucosus TaxID=1378264 RepID=A0A9P8PGU4_9ASCO|nr:hypothetical protein WICMUC_004550 [Wickerhamomyces mucosus]